MNPEREKKWIRAGENSAKASEIASALSINSKIASLLINRGADTVEKASKFLYSVADALYNPFIFTDMAKAAGRLKRAIDAKEHILVYGDRDVDGITAVNVIVNSIRILGGNVQWYVPADEGYGIHKDILSKYAAENVKILITVDCGISAVEEIKYANTLGMDVILTDHHEPPYDGIPQAYAVINPKTLNSGYPFKDIAGCAVALKTAQAVTLAFSKEYNKEITLCVSCASGDDFAGRYMKIKNGLETGKAEFKSCAEFKNAIKDSFRIYCDSHAIAEKLVKSNALLKERIFVIENKSGQDIDAFFKNYLSYAFNSDVKMKEFFLANLDLCALGTIADSMPLLDENRIIVKEGIKILETNPSSHPGLGLLLEDILSSRNIQSVTARSISWNVTPMLNSAGRMGRGMLSAQLLMTKDAFQAKNLYSDIIKLNENRRWLQSENIEQFGVLLKEQCDLENDKILIVKASNLEHGVTGIVASQMVKTYSKPAFLLITDGNEATGAVRSIDGFDIIAALESVKDILVKYGGHSQAAGFTIAHSKIDEFKERILAYAEDKITLPARSEGIFVETELKISDISVDFYRQIETLEPFGMGNVRPVFCIKGVNATEVSLFGGKSEHLKFKISQNGSRHAQAVFWNKASYSSMLRCESSLDIAFNLDVIGRNDKQIAQLTVIDIKPAI
ncbi:MAG: single-stranded-DNA-specific exonuclease RecJ [Endomicrobium sp.]|jgi:single-stranded-DNA-specific exonuclease|nr:single-stranded-DNA-specific exonuclease RecJ [Endomicrobium sp.]